jgi:hypothetical protein
MDAHGEHDDLTDEGDQGTYQERATAMLDLIAQRTKLALSEAGIDIDIFFLVSQNSNAILTFGTPADPPDDLWATVGEIVSIYREKFARHRANTMQRARVCLDAHRRRNLNAGASTRHIRSVSNPVSRSRMDIQPCSARQTITGIGSMMAAMIGLESC